MRYAAKVDANQPEIVAALRAVGASVRPIHTLGAGVPDLLVGWRGGNYLLEVKTPTGELTPAERKFAECWRGQAATVRSVDDALQAIGAIDR